jgi:hypothetical protein
MKTLSDYTAQELSDCGLIHLRQSQIEEAIKRMERKRIEGLLVANLAAQDAAIAKGRGLTGAEWLANADRLTGLLAEFHRLSNNLAE